ncbi:hypothetical protein EOI86_21105 [Hwanghaeella grinnelliae]|uniref:Bacterioferritin-associated ferredoxin n=1 Tax=Hwanghaeella grinnelliae TaxID=2500179 RepID=A0A3S2Z4K2_9PROT|nr:(2Fe-2S)-binding protein [Hwanghaeella grinnelliae]RVU33657.1 hypothetical protein EOI86_21105 [Hwanghaeella grinnelliae]
MFICICNALSDSELKDAIAQGHGSVDDVYRACGAERQCGCCAENIAEMMREHRDDNWAIPDGEGRVVAA